MQGAKRKFTYVVLFELIAIGCTTSMLAALGHRVDLAGSLAVATSIIAMGWNLLYNMLFEAWEARQATKGRSIARRMAHVTGFEGGLVVLLVPLVAWWLHLSLLDAFILDMGLIAFFLVYGFVFNWAFDWCFGLPASAAPRPVGD
jgi:uncharacterized membrane protein